jgi:hypothetical protein
LHFAEGSIDFVAKTMSFDVADIDTGK